ncbi:MAG: hypothetical protein LBP53_01940 [Candidatus Peribacteria bacterium]|nr:hypothetical protein [Candidatus Peribacteria bacterium]
MLASGFDDEQSEPSSPAFSHLFSSDCTYRQEGTTYRLPAHCVLQGKLPTLPLPTIVDLLRDEIGDFREQYQPFAPTYRYYGGQPIFSSAFSSLLDGSFEASQQLIRFTQQGKEI